MHRENFAAWCDAIVFRSRKMTDTVTLPDFVEAAETKHPGVAGEYSASELLSSECCAQCFHRHDVRLLHRCKRPADSAILVKGSILEMRVTHPGCESKRETQVIDLSQSG